MSNVGYHRLSVSDCSFLPWRLFETVLCLALVLWTLHLLCGILIIYARLLPICLFPIPWSGAGLALPLIPERSLPCQAGMSHRLPFWICNNLLSLIIVPYPRSGAGKALLILPIFTLQYCQAPLTSLFEFLSHPRIDTQWSAYVDKVGRSCEGLLSC